MTNETAIGQALKSKIQALTDLSVTYLTEERELLQYPAVTIMTNGWKSSFADTARNNNEYYFYIRLYYRNDNIPNAEATMRDLADKIFSALTADLSLNGTCDYSLPAMGRPLQARRETDVYVHLISLTAYKQVFR
jgi:hypothetical protein